MGLHCPGFSESQLKSDIQGEERDQNKIKLTRAFIKSNVTHLKQGKEGNIRLPPSLQHCLFSSLASVEREMQSNFSGTFFSQNWTFCIYTEALNSLTIALINFSSYKKISPTAPKPHYSWLNLQTPLDEKYQKIACPISCSTFPIAVTQAIKLIRLYPKRRKGDKSLNFSTWNGISPLQKQGSESERRELQCS